MVVVLTANVALTVASGGASLAASGPTTVAIATTTGPACVAAGPFGLAACALLGAAEDGLSWDCWKPVLHDSSPTPSSGMMLKEVYADARLKTVTLADNKLIIQNIWEEKFDITFFDIPGHGIAAHATKI